MPYKSTFLVERMDHYISLGEPYYSKPIEIASFSIDEKGGYHPDRSQLKIFHPDPDIVALGDLTHNISSFVPKSSLLEPQLDDLLRSIEHYDISLIGNQS